MSIKFLDLLKEKVIVFDGAMGSNLQSLNLTIEDWGGANFENCSENLLYTKPEAIEKVHVGFLEAGVDVIETNSFGGGEVVLAEFGIADKAYDVNKKAAELARRLANDYSTESQQRFVAGSIGPGTKLPTLGHITYENLKKSYDQQIHGLYDGGVDMFIVETAQDLLQIKAALASIFDFFAERKVRIPVITQVTIESFGTMLNGTEISAALTALEPFPIDLIGMNCGTGPDQMTENVKFLCENSPLPISVLPNAGMPEVKDGQQFYTETPEDFSKKVEHFAKDFGANVVGGCCGTSFEHLRQVVEKMQGVSPKQRDFKFTPAAASIYFSQPYTQDNSFLIVGERVNASGSKKMRDLLNAEDWDGLIKLAKEQEREGAHILDVNVDFVGRDGVADMHELVSKLVTNVKIPLMLDSTEWEKMEAGLKLAGGKCILNSTNYEDGEPRFLKVLELAKEYAAAVVIGLIDEEGMARTAENKLKIARRAYQQATEFGIEAHDIFFDPLALPISTGIEEDRMNAAETIKSIKQIHEEMPEANIILGVSNISFGLNPAARVVLNSIFLHECVEAGMNSAIVNASKILPLNRFNEHEIEVALDLIYDKRKWSSDTPVRMSAKHEQKSEVLKTQQHIALSNEADKSVRVPSEGKSARVEVKKGWHSRGFIPHFDGNRVQFITFRLADSLPQNILNQMKDEIAKDKLDERSNEYRELTEKYLDQGIGSCILMKPEIAKIVEDTIAYEHEKSCKVISWVIMPNHVHLLLHPLEGHSLSDIIKRIKGVSARKINQKTNSTGTVWQFDYFDRYIRDEEHFLKTVSYIAFNPVKAGLCESPAEWEFLKRWSSDTLVRMSPQDEPIVEDLENSVAASGDSDKSVRVPSDICVYDPLGEFTTMFEGKTAKSMKVDTSNLTIEEKLKHHIIDGEKIGLEENLTKALEKYPALDIVNNILLDGMKVVGDLFGSGQMQLPFVLQSAEVMKTAVKFLEPFMEKVEGETSKGVMVLATVKGDVHDIGKNLVDIILTNNGYRVHNIGIKQTIEDILHAYEETKADAIGMSGLLVKSTLVMRDNLEIMNERGINVPVILGGAALNRKYVDNDLIPIYNGKLFYARDAFDGLHAMDELTGERNSDTLVRMSPQDEPIVEDLENAVAASGDSDKSVRAPIQTVDDVEDLVGEDAKLGMVAARVQQARTNLDTTHTTKSDVQPAEIIPPAPFYGSKVVEITDLNKVFEFINETALFKGQWQYKQGKSSKEDYAKLLEKEVYPKFKAIKAQAIREKLLEAKLVYGYFPCRSENNDLIILQDDEKTERLRFTFPRQPIEQRGSKNLCLADYFSAYKIDVVAFHLVTMGRKASEHSAKLFKADNYTDYLLFHGLSVESAEALAEMWHKRIREELGYAQNDAQDLNKLFHQGYQGSRYSFGYPACPNLEDQTKLFELLQPERIDVELSEEFQLHPEQSTSAIIIHHPEAKYFNIA